MRHRHHFRKKKTASFCMRCLFFYLVNIFPCVLKKNNNSTHILHAFTTRGMVRDKTKKMTFDQNYVKGYK